MPDDDKKKSKKPKSSADKIADGLSQGVFIGLIIYGLFWMLVEALKLASR